MPIKDNSNLHRQSGSWIRETVRAEPGEERTADAHAQCCTCGTRYDLYTTRKRIECRPCRAARRAAS